MVKQLALGIVVLVMLPRSGAGQRAATFAPAVTADDDSNAVCATQYAAVLQPDERGYVLRFTTGATGARRRVVAAVWDTSGHLRRYSDARGDLRGPPVPISERGERTTIAIDFVKGIALLTNESHGRSTGGTLTTASDALAAERLGPPKRLLERLHTQCGAPTP